MASETAVVCPGCERGTGGGQDHVGCTPESRFWRKVDKSGDCWEWRGFRGANGYGKAHLTRKPSTYAHRIAWTLTNGPIPKGMHVCHHCDNPPCCNPAHLFLGTAKDNVHDMMVKGRHNPTPRKTECINGHPFDAKNTGHNGGRRFCRACQKVSVQRSRARLHPTPKCGKCGLQMHRTKNWSEGRLCYYCRLEERVA